MRMHRGGFTLIELLVVLGIIGLLVAISIPALNSISKGADLGAASTMISGQLDLARQTAATMSRPIEVRIYETKDSKGTPFYNAVGFYEVGEDGDGNESFNLQGKITYLPRGAVFLTTNNFSTLITDDTLSTGQANIPSQPSSNYTAFRFRPSGGTELEQAPGAGSAWTLTIVPVQDVTATTLPPNYAVLTLNPTVGLVRVSRP